MESFDIAVIGAGKTGRGFVGRLLQESGLRFLLVDRDPALIAALTDAGSYEVRFFGDVRPPQRVSGYLALTPDDERLPESLRATRLVFVSVGGTHLTEVAAWLARQGLHKAPGRTAPCSVVLCENAEKPADRFRTAFLDAVGEKDRATAAERFGFSEATVFCTTIEAKPHALDILSEDLPDLPCDAAPLKPGLPAVKGLVPTPGFSDFLVRKLYTYNSASAAISYLGGRKGYEVYADAANDPGILLLLDKLYEEVGKAMCLEYGYPEEDQRAFAARSLAKFRDRTILDSIARNAREPHRKLGRNERIIGPALLIEKHGGDATPLVLTAAAALLYQDASDETWSGMQKELGPEGILATVSGLPADSGLAQKILAQYRILQEWERSGRRTGVLLGRVPD